LTSIDHARFGGEDKCVVLLIRHTFRAKPAINPRTIFGRAIFVDLSLDCHLKDHSTTWIETTTLNIALPDHWSVTLYPSNDIRINYGDPISGQKGRLFFPFDVAIGRKIAKAWTASLEVSVPMIRDYPVYNFKSELHISVQF
jgi:hypothetical protein